SDHVARARRRRLGGPQRTDDAGWLRAHTAHLARLRRRLRRDDGDGSHLERRRRIQGAELEERRDHAWLDGDDPRRLFSLDELPGASLRRDADRCGNRNVAARPAYLRRWGALLSASVLDVRAV